MVDIRYFDVNSYMQSELQIPGLLIRQMINERLDGNLVFVYAKNPYYEVHKKFYKYANGFVTNDACYVQMGCCEVLFSHPLREQEIIDLYEKLHGYATVVIHSVKGSYTCSENLFENRQIQKYCLKNHVYSCSAVLNDKNDFKLVEEMLAEIYLLEPCGNDMCFFLVRRNSLEEEAKKHITEFFKRMV